LSIHYVVHHVDDDSKKPKSHKVFVPNATVRVFIRGDACPNNLFVTRQPKHWGPIFETCPSFASGTTNANGDVFISLPPTGNNPNQDYVVIGKSPAGFPDNDDDDADSFYSGKQVNNLKSCDVKDVTLRKIRRFDGKVAPCGDDEDWGTHLVIVSPDYVDWTSTVERYPFVIEAEGTWDVTTAITTPEGFVADASELSASITDDSGGLQFTLTDVGSSWTGVSVTHNIVHKGKKIKHTRSVKMFDKKKPKDKAAFERVPGAGPRPDAESKNVPAPFSLFASAFALLIFRLAP
jgi:hypothetical protein